ncbi:hypothetical protein PybrP1_004999, partial [[Pythium] brassicae (nom. inval.)]
MFETLVTGVLTSALGNYIDARCFSSDKINVAVWSGYVVLHQLELKPDVIAHPAVRLVRGVVGSIELKIPWNRLHSDSVVVTVDDVYVLVRTEEDIERAVLEMDEHALKKKLLEELYAQAKRQDEAASAASESSAGDSGFAARLVNKIIDNLELHIRRIHIRVEDHATGDHPFALGLTIESVHVQPSYVDTSKSSEPRIYKVVELNHLSVYVNPDCDVLRSQRVDFARCSLDEFASCFSRSIPKRFDDRHYQHTQLYPSHQQHHFVLRPIDAHARLVVNRDPFDTSGPKFDLAVNVPEVALRLEDSQYCDLLYLASAFQIPDHVAKYQHYKRLRPRSAVLDAVAGEWWRYAITAVLQDVRAKRQRWSWAYLKQRREDRRKYVAAWERRSRRLLKGRERSYVDSESEEDDEEEDEDDYGADGGNGAGDDGLDHEASTLSESYYDEEDEKASVASSGHSHSSQASSRSGGVGGPSGGAGSVLEEIERKRPVEDILFFRFLADRRAREAASSANSRSGPARAMPLPASAEFSDTESVDTEQSESTMPTEAKFRSWGAWMFGWTSKLTAATDGSRDEEAPRRVLPEVELRELFKILEYEPSKQHKKTKKKANKHGELHDLDDLEPQSEETRITVTLGKGSLTLSSDVEATKSLRRDDPSYSNKYAPTDFLLGTFAHLQLAAVASGDAIKVDVSLQSIEGFDESSESSAFSRLLSRKPGGTLGGAGSEIDNAAFSGPVFLLSYETNPAHSSADAALYIHMEPLEVVFSPTATCWGRLSGFLNTPKVLGLWAELEVASFNDIVNLKARTEAKLKYAMANRIAVSVDLRIQAPVLVIPASDTDIDCARLLVDLGHINFRTDRLSKLDGENTFSTSSSSSGAPLSGMGGGSSLALLNPASSPNLSSSTSFVKQLYDEAEKGEGAIRWKEEFYDKFSLSVTNVHVSLVPYGKTRASNPVAAGPSLPQPTPSEEQEYELVERFNINVTVRMSVLPLDATLTRFYVHADLPALTFKMSLEKYFQLAGLVERFSLAGPPAAEAENESSPFESSFFDTTDLFEGLDAPPFDQDDRLPARRKSSFLSTSALRRTAADDDSSHAFASAADTTRVDSGDSDGESSTGSDDTWFSIASGTVDASLLLPETPALGWGSSTESLYSDAAAWPTRTVLDALGAEEPPLLTRKKSRRANNRSYAAASAQQTALLDRRLMVCTFTFPLISVQLKKPSSTSVPASASYRYDGTYFDEDLADTGTIVVKLQGFRVRVAKKTLSLQANCSVRSLEVEDYLDASGKASEFLLFSCPTIVAPFSMRAPQRRPAKLFASSVVPRHRPNRQRERVISFQRAEAASSAQPARQPGPENLLDFVFSSVNDSLTGNEAQRDMDIRVGCLQFNFDQSYICSLLELVDETVSRLALGATAPAPNASSALADLTDDELLPPLQLSPSVSQAYALPMMSLTESVRADLENARKQLLETHAKARRRASVSDGRRQLPAPVLLKVSVRTQSLSVCFCDRSEPEVSLAVLRVQAQVSTLVEGDVVVKGTVGDVKVFDLSPTKRSAESESGAPYAAGASQRDFVDIFGLDTSAKAGGDSGAGAVPQFIMGIDCRIVKTSEELDARDAAAVPRRSSVNIVVQPIQLLVQPDFVESVTSYVTDGPLCVYLASRSDARGQRPLQWDRAGATHHPRSQSFGLEDLGFARHPRSQSFLLETSSAHGAQSPFFDAGFASPQQSMRMTPFFDSVADPLTKRAEKDAAQRAQKAEETRATGAQAPDEQEPAAPRANLLDAVDLEFKLFKTNIVLPSMQLESAQPGSGVCLCLGTVSGSVVSKTGLFGSDERRVSAEREVRFGVSGMAITFLPEQLNLLEPMGVTVRCTIPEQRAPPGNKDAAESSVDPADRPRMTLGVEVSPVCVNLGERTLSLGLDVFYGTIKPILDIVSATRQGRDRDDTESLLGSMATRDDSEADAKSLAAGSRDRVLEQQQQQQEQMGLRASIIVDEIKVALQAHSEAPQLFELWMKNALDASDDGHPRDVAGVLGSNAPGSPRRQRHDAWNRKPSLPKMPGATTVVEIVASGLRGTARADSLGGLGATARVEFSVQTAMIRDKIADPEAAADKREAPQLLVQLDVAPTAQEGCERSDHAVVVSLASARVNVLPRTLLRLEHFGAETLVAVRRRAYQLEAQYKPRMLLPSSAARTHGYLDGMREFAESRGDESLLQRSQAFNHRGGATTESSRAGLTGVAAGRKDSVSDSVKDTGDGKKSAFASPRNQSGPYHEDRQGKLTANDLSSSVHAAFEEEKDEDEAVEQVLELELPPPQETPHVVAQHEDDDARRCVWTVRVELSNLSLWLLSTDKKTDAAGVKLAANVRAEIAAFSGDRYPAAALRKELLISSAEVGAIELSISSPIDERLETESRAVRGMHFPWTIVEPFSVRADVKSSFCMRSPATDEAGSAVVFNVASSADEKVFPLTDDAAKQPPAEWTDWMHHEPTVEVDRIASRVSYRNLPVLLQIASSLTSVASADEKIRETFAARIKALEDEFGWDFSVDEPHAESSYYQTPSERADEGSESPDELQHGDCVASKHSVTQASLQMRGLQFQVINNIVDQASPVLGFNIGHVSATLLSKSDAELKLSLATTLDAWYHNLRLVASEPLIEPWKVNVVVSRQASATPTLEEAAVNDDSHALQMMPIEVKIQSSETLQLNLTEAFIANMMAATRAWEWVVHEGGDPREMTEYSTYWIRNTTGLNLHYWGKACKPSTLLPGGEEPMEFVEGEGEGEDVQCSHASGAPTTRDGDYQWSGAERSYLAGNRQIFVAVFEDEDASDVPSEFEKKWQSETAISVDQVDSRMYALVNADTDIFSARLRKCECVIDVLVERGRKVFVVRSTLLLENNTGSDLEVEFVPPPAQYVSPQSTPDVSPIWRSVVKASSVVPVPLHLVSLGEGHIVTRPPEIKAADANGTALPKPYAAERVRLPVLDRDTAASGSDDLTDVQSTMKFHRLYSDRPVRPFIMRACLSSSSDGFCLSTPNDWTPAVDAAGGAVGGAHQHRWEDVQQRLRERGTINVADAVVWHLSDWDTPLELSVRMKGFEWSEPVRLGNESAECARLRMKDLVTDSLLYVTAEFETKASKCREIFLFVPYWIVNLTGLKLEYEFDDERTGTEHPTTAKLRSTDATDAAGSSARDHERKRRHPCLLPSVPPIKGLLDLLPKSIDDPKTLGQLEVLQVCHSDHRSERGCVRLRVNDDELSGGLDSAKESAQRKWSDAIVLDQTGTSGVVESADFASSRNYSVGYSISAAKGRYSRTKVVMLTPRFMLVNTLGCAIEVCHSSAKFSTTTAAAIDIGSSVHLPNNGMMSSMNSVVRLDAGAYADFHWTLRFGKTRAIRCRIAEFGWSWSGAVPLGDSGEYAVRMRHESTRESKLLRLTLKLDGSCVCVYFREESASAPPYRVENYSLETLRIHQFRVRRSEILLPHHSLDYAWDEPTQERMLVVDMLPSAAGDNSRPLRIGTFALDKIQQYPDALGRTLGIEVSTDGPTRVLRFTDARLRGDRGANVALLPPDAKAAAAASSVTFGNDVLRRFVSAPTLRFELELQGVGVSVVDGVPKELVYASVAGIHLQVVWSEDDRGKSSAYITRDGDAGGSRLERETTARIVAMRFEVRDVQIDNQLQGTPFPVLLRFSNSAARSQSVDGAVVHVPALQLDLVKHDEYAGINFIRYLSAKALPVHVRVDGSLLSHLAPLVMDANAYGAADHVGQAKRGTASSSSSSRRSPSSLLLDDFHASLEVNVKILEAIREEEATTSIAHSSLSMHTNRSKTDGAAADVRENNGSGHAYAPPPVPVYPTQGKFTRKDEEKKLYFEEFYIDPIRATVSFTFGSGVMVADGQYGRSDGGNNSRGGGGASSSSSSFADSASSAVTVGPLRLILNAIGTSLTKIANAPFHLKALEISHSFVQPDALATRLTSHYQSEALRQAYVILGSVDVLGNPMIAWKNLKGGFQDFIYEPAYGIAKSPTDFVLGVGRGSLSLVRASVYTFLDFNSRILTASALGLAEACVKLDDYTGYPATRNIYQGFAQGISGLVVSPIHSVEMNGVRGVVPGVFAGVFGLVLKPLLGISLAAATTTATLRDAIDPNTKALLMRVRPPRFIDLRTRRLKVYSYVESLGEEIVSKLRGGRYRGDGYVGHVDLRQKCLLVTRKRIMLLAVRGGGESGASSSLQYDVEWELLAEEVILIASKGEDAVTLYYIREDFSQRRREPVAPSGMLLSKYVVALPDNKLLFVRAMLQQMERSLITKMNSGRGSGGADSAVAVSPIDRSPWPPHQQQQHQHQRAGGGFEYPMFRLPSTM